MAMLAARNITCVRSIMASMNKIVRLIENGSKGGFKVNKLSTSQSDGSLEDAEVPSLPQARHFPAIKTPMLPPDTFTGKVALISGGGTGLGKGMATMLSQLGAQVCIMSRRQHVLDAAAAELTALTGGAVLAVSADVRDPAALAVAVDACVDRFGLPDVVINNAAGNFISPTERLSPNAWKTVVDIVLNGTAYLTLDVGKRWIKAERGGVVLSITTNYTRLGSAFVTPSSAAKSGVETLTKSLSSEWGRYGIRLNCLAPGPIYSEGAFSRLDPSGQTRWRELVSAARCPVVAGTTTERVLPPMQALRFRAAGMESIPSGRFGEVEELANLATYLVSDYASWISGESVALDGGELPYRGGQFNQLSKIDPDQWDQMEQMIRSTNKKSKL